MDYFLSPICKSSPMNYQNLKIEKQGCLLTLQPSDEAACFPVR